MRPLMAAEPMLRAPRPEIVSASTTQGGGLATDVRQERCGAAADLTRTRTGRARGGGQPQRRRCAPFEHLVVDGDVGFDRLERDLDFCWLPFAAISMANGRKMPFTGL